MYDFRLKVFYVVANRLNFTKAAAELFISQPAVSKHIHEIEVYYETQLFERHGSKISLTKAGHILLKNVENLMDIYRNIEIEIAAQKDVSHGHLKVGASTTVAQYFLPKRIADFKVKFPKVQISLISDNTEHIENLLVENKIDIGVVEGYHKRSSLKYQQLAKDEIVLCTRAANRLINKESVTVEELYKLPLVLREVGSGTLDVIASKLEEHDFSVADLKREMVLPSSESIKSYLLHSDTCAFLSIHSILKELKNKELRVVEIDDMDFERIFWGITKHGDTNRLQELFFRHISTLE